MLRTCLYCNAAIPDDARAIQKYCSKLCNKRARRFAEGIRPHGTITPVPAATLSKVEAWRAGLQRQREQEQNPPPVTRIPQRMDRCSSCLEIVPAWEVEYSLCVKCTLQVEARESERKRQGMSGVVACWCGRVQCQRHREEREAK